MFKLGKRSVHIESVNFVESYVVRFDINGPSNLTKMMPVIGMEGMSRVTCPF